jgi:cytidylate kinase
MAIITISRGSYSKGKEVAEKVAERLGYECLSRDILLDASDRFHIPQIKLVRAIHDAPSILDRFGSSKQTYIAYIQSALANAACKDNVVYHGLAGHVLLPGIGHVLRVRILADIAMRIANEMEREDICYEEARFLLLKDDQERRRWSQHLYGVDPVDPCLYDLLIRIHRLDVDDAVEFICQAATKDQFKTTKESQQNMEDLALACRVKAALADDFPEISISSQYGNVVVYTKSSGRPSQKLERKVRALAKEMKDINNLEIHPGSPAPEGGV